MVESISISTLMKSESILAIKYLCGLCLIQECRSLNLKKEKGPLLEINLLKQAFRKITKNYERRAYLSTMGDVLFILQEYY